jgi:RNA polymerase-binding transcription factor DksA
MGKTKKLNKKDLNELKKLLIQQQMLIQGDVSMLEEDMDSSRKSSGSFSKIPTHPSDVGGDNYEQDFTYERIEAEGNELIEIRDALKKIETGSYGVCEMCNSNIRKSRLKAIPYCKYCITCQEEAEKQQL